MNYKDTETSSFRRLCDSVAKIILPRTSRSSTCRQSRRESSQRPLARVSSVAAPLADIQPLPPPPRFPPASLPREPDASPSHRLLRSKWQCWHPPETDHRSSEP